MNPLKPRAIAALCALRQGPLCATRLGKAIGDGVADSTENLVNSMRDSGVIGQPANDDRWYLNHAGVGWLASHGLDTVPAAQLHTDQAVRQ